MMPPYFGSAGAAYRGTPRVRPPAHGAELRSIAEYVDQDGLAYLGALHNAERTHAASLILGTRVTGQHPGKAQDRFPVGPLQHGEVGQKLATGRILSPC